LGGYGSALVLKRGTFEQHSDGTFTGTFLARPDRGYNVYVLPYVNKLCLSLDLYVFSHVALFLQGRNR